MYIESALLSERHADIKFVPSFAPSMPSFMSWATTSTGGLDVANGDSANEAMYDRQGSYILKDL